MPKFIIEYNVTHHHVVQMGIEAPTEDAALREGEQAVSSGSLWESDDNPILLMDDYEESDNNDLVLRIREKVDEFPEPDASVVQLELEQAARRACQILVNAYHQSRESGASVDWQDVDDAYTAACIALAVEP